MASLLDRAQRQARARVAAKELDGAAAASPATPPVAHAPALDPTSFFDAAADLSPRVASLAANNLPSLPPPEAEGAGEPPRIPFMIRLTSAEKELLDQAAHTTRYSRQYLVRAILFPELRKLLGR